MAGLTGACAFGHDCVVLTDSDWNLQDMKPIEKGLPPTGDEYGSDPAFMDEAKRMLGEVKSLAVESIAAKDGLSILRMVEQVENLAENCIEQVENADPRKVACREGCSFCCSQAVTATVPEIVRVADHIRAHWTSEMIHALRERIQGYKKVLMPFTFGQGEVAPRHPCPLLKDGACSVWLARPLVCRSYNSFDSKPCEAKANDPNSPIPVLGLWKQRAVADALGIGIYRAIREKGLWPDGCDLILGLEIALDHEDAGARFAAGDPLFEPAACRGAREWKAAQSATSAKKE
jgi:Fe-S-cluster containining protein